MPGTGPGQAAGVVVIPNPEAGILLVRATERRHREIRRISTTCSPALAARCSSRRTIVEIELSDRHQAGVDWSWLARNAGVSVQQSLLAGNLAVAPYFTLAAAKGFRPLAEDGIRRVREGITSLEEVSRVVDLTDRVGG